MFGISDDKQDDQNQDMRHEHSDGASETLEHDSSSPAYKISSPSEPQDDYSAGASDNDNDSDADNLPAEDPTAHTDSPAQDTNELFQLKQKTLQKLAPLVSHLDQSPEEKFKTTMMLIQASDNADLLEEAYAAANEITDEKTRAQALLDVVNEINYFTQKPTH